jgi:hypothetical protein
MGIVAASSATAFTNCEASGTVTGGTMKLGGTDSKHANSEPTNNLTAWKDVPSSVAGGELTVYAICADLTPQV